MSGNIFDRQEELKLRESMGYDAKKMAELWSAPPAPKEIEVKAEAWRFSMVFSGFQWFSMVVDGFLTFFWGFPSIFDAFRCFSMVFDGFSGSKLVFGAGDALPARGSTAHADGEERPVDTAA